MDITELTPIERHNDIYVKRDDLYKIYNSQGGKARSAYQIIAKAIQSGHKNFVTAGSRVSPQCEIVSDICEGLNVHCHLFMPRGKETSVLKHISQNKLSELHRTKVGYNSVICKWALDYANENDFYYIPFGMECEENVEITQHQVTNIPKRVKRIVVPVGSGMSFISICNGLELYEMYNVGVLGVSVGKDVKKNIQKYLSAPHIKYKIVKSDLEYHKESKEYTLGDLELDKIYEAKCLPYLKANDCLWVVGKRQ